MSFFKRLKNVVSAKANKALEKHENPIELLELSITKKEKLLLDAKKQCAKFIATVDTIRNEKKDLEARMNKYEEATKAALLKEDMEKAQSFVKQKLELQEKVVATDARIKEQDEKIQLIKNKIFHVTISSKKIQKILKDLWDYVTPIECNFDCSFDNICNYKWEDNTWQLHKEYVLK